jgi:hypothetical protein
MNKSMVSQWIMRSVRAYRAMLVLYPTDYRREYGPLMVQFFRDVSVDKYHRHGLLGIALWWCKTFLDLTLTVIEQHRKVKYPMSKSTLIQLAGNLLIAAGMCGAVAAFSQLQPDNHDSFYGIYRFLTWLIAPSLLLGGLGCIGLALRFDQALGALGQWTLHLSGIGALVMAVGAVAMSLTDTLRNLWLGGNLIFTIGLIAFGLAHLSRPALPIFRALPLQMAAGWLVMVLGLPERFAQPTDNLLTFLFLLGMGLVCLAIGSSVSRQQGTTVLPAA